MSPNPSPEPTDFPADSKLDRRWIESAYFVDAYRAPLRNPHAAIADIFHAIFAHHPLYMKIALIVRNAIVSCLGLDAAPASHILHPRFKPAYAVGDTIGPWPVYYASESELIVGRDNRHLDFRLSVLRQADGDAASVVVSTICTVHNGFGKMYLFFVIPFHRWGVKRIIARAMAAGRL